MTVKVQHDSSLGDAGDMAAFLALNDAVFRPMHEDIARWLGAGRGMRVLEAGCGAGGMAIALAAAGAHVTATDIRTQCLEATLALAREHGLEDRVEVREADATAMPFADATFDLVWCSRAVHHMPDMVAATRELTRNVRPGGRLALREGGLATRVLPDEIGIGVRGLEDRIGSAGVALFHAMRDGLDGSTHYAYGWARLLRDAGLTGVEARLFPYEELAPLRPETGAYVVAGYRRWMGREDVSTLLDASDRETLAELTDETSPHYVLQRDDLHLRTADSVYVGTRGQDAPAHANEE